MATLSERLFDDDLCNSAAAEIEDILKMASVPYQKLGWDDYDNSLEIYGVPPQYRLTEMVQKALFDGGFSTIYVNHTDKWETHYNHAPEKGWRVSYPHKREIDDGHIWVEEHCETWPKDWFDSGYVQIKSPTDQKARP